VDAIAGCGPAGAALPRIGLVGVWLVPAILSAGRARFIFAFSSFGRCGPLLVGGFAIGASFVHFALVMVAALMPPRWPTEQEG